MKKNAFLHFLQFFSACLKIFQSFALQLVLQNIYKSSTTSIHEPETLPIDKISDRIPDLKSALSGEYSCLQVDLMFAREVSYYIITIYLPTLMIVIVSWFSFWIDHKSVS